MSPLSLEVLLWYIDSTNTDERLNFCFTLLINSLSEFITDDSTMVIYNLHSKVVSR